MKTEPHLFIIPWAGPSLSSRWRSVREECSEGRSRRSHLAPQGCSLHHLLKACVKGAVFALEELLPSVLVPVMAPDALDIARGEFTEFAVKNGFCFLLSAPWGPRKRHGAHTAVVSRQSSGLIVVQLLLNIWRLRVGWVCEQTAENYSRHGGHRGEVQHLKTPERSFEYFFFKGADCDPSFHLHLHSTTHLWGKTGSITSFNLTLRVHGI